MSRQIHAIAAREILDSRGNPTVEAEITMESGLRAKAAVPSGASTGSREACELRDGDMKRFRGLGVRNAVKNIVEKIAPALRGTDVTDQRGIDERMIELDGTKDKRKLGANAILAVSLAAARSTALIRECPLYRVIGGLNAVQLPIPMLNLINGGAHSDANLDFQEFMVRPVGAPDFQTGLRWCTDVFQTLRVILRKRGCSTGVGDEGGFAPNLKNAEDALECLLKAISDAGLKAGRTWEGGEVSLALDCAATEFYDGKRKIYESKKAGSIARTGEEQIRYLLKLIDAYPLDSVEDPLSEDDWENWTAFQKALPYGIQSVGDDLLTTNRKYLERAIRRKACNAILIKPNQIGTLTETLEVIRTAKNAGFGVIVSHRSGETPDDFIADLAVGTNAGQIKTGSITRGERISKYNRLLEIERELKKQTKKAD